MDKFRIRGGRPLHGTVTISGAKNSALPAMAAALLTVEPVTLRNVPMVRDIITMGKLLAFMSAKVSTAELPSTAYTIESHTLNDAVAPYELVKTMRASILTLGPAIARSGIAHVSSARRMRHWRAAGRPASRSTGKNGRGNHHGTRLHWRKSLKWRSLARRAHRL